MGFSRQEHWSGLPFPPPGDLPNPGIKPVSFMSPALAGGFITTSTTWEACLDTQNGGAGSQKKAGSLRTWSRAPFMCERNICV